MGGGEGEVMRGHPYVGEGQHSLCFRGSFYFLGWTLRLDLKGKDSNVVNCSAIESFLIPPNDTTKHSISLLVKI